MNSYKVLSKQTFTKGDFSIVPIRFEDRLDIMKWRNEQIYHLRQAKPLTIEDQNAYFENVVSKLFDQEQPNQLLFSFLKNDTCIGYGGLVHINWVDKHAEISFIMQTSLEKSYFMEIWKGYLSLIETVAFNELLLHKLYTYAYDLRPHLYNVFESNGFNKDAILRDHKIVDQKYVDVIIHSKINYNGY
jgi:RimJ/RimL family protein N-acetyltransferase